MIYLVFHAVIFVLCLFLGWNVALSFRTPFNFTLHIVLYKKISLEDFIWEMFEHLMFMWEIFDNLMFIWEMFDKLIFIWEMFDNLMFSREILDGLMFIYDFFMFFSFIVALC